MVIADETSWIAYGPIKVLRIYGMNNNASDRYIQLFDANALAGVPTSGGAYAPEASAVPAVPGLYVQASKPFYWDFPAGLELSELFLAISSTQVTYTAVTNTGLDLTIEYDTNYAVDNTMSLVGDIDTAAAQQQVWASAAGPKRLLSLKIINSAGTDAYAYASKSDSPTTRTSTMQPIGPVLDASTSYFHFGPRGLQLNTASNETPKGCTIVMYPITAGVVTDTNLSGSDFQYRAVISSTF